MSSIYFHEDDRGQIELLPAENAGWCRAEVARIEDFARARSSGIEGSDVCERREPEVPLTSRRIARADLREAIHPLLPAFDFVTTGYAGDVQAAPSIDAFGFAKEIVLYADSKDGIVNSMWLHFEPGGQETLRKSRAALAKCDHWNLLLTDWRWGAVIALADVIDMKSYLARRHDVFAEATLLSRLRRWLPV